MPIVFLNNNDRPSDRTQPTKPRKPGVVYLEYDPNEPRDDHGRWTDVGGSSSGGSGSDKPKPGSGTTEAPTAEAAAESERRRTVVEGRAWSIAIQMGIPTSAIHVVDKEPTPFKVGNVEFREAGHYDPRTNEIEINSRNSYDDRMSVTRGIAAHEVLHYQYDAVRKEQEKEHVEIGKMIADDQQYEKYWRKNGYLKPEYADEMARRFPASGAFANLWGDAYLDQERFLDSHKKMSEEDGHSSYAKTYWTPEGSVNTDRTVNETLAEVSRYRNVHGSWNEPNNPSDLWLAQEKNIEDAYRVIKLKGNDTRASYR